MMKIDAGRVEEILIHSLVSENDHVDGKKLNDDEVIVVNGIINNYAFHKERLLSHKEEVLAFVENLDPELKDGISFLGLCVDKDGSQWGEHRSCENLMCLAIGLGLMRYVLPRESWTFLPGGVPLLMLTKNK